VHISIRQYGVVSLAILLAVVTGCSNDGSSDPVQTVEPTPAGTPLTLAAEDGFPASAEDITFITVATDAPARFQEFGDIDPLGNVIGFDPGIMAALADIVDIDFEFVVTGYAGLLDSVSNGEFDSAMSSLLIPGEPVDGLIYTDPYLEVGQVLVVLANNSIVQSHRDLVIGIPIGVQQYSSAEQTARDVVGLLDSDIQLYDTPAEVVQALIDRQVDGIIMDHDDAEYYTATYPQQLRITGDQGREAWITEKEYGIAVSEGNTALLELLNEAIAIAVANGAVEALTQEWLVSQALINAGESLVGTLSDELVIGIVGELTSLDPAARDRDLIGWEVRHNIMSGLLRVDAQNNLAPSLAEDFPLISEDKLEYTFRIKPNLIFPDGSELTAEDVRFSITRAAGLGNFQVNRYLKDENEDGFADVDAVQVLDPMTVKFVLDQPTSFFPSVLATPPYSIISESCYAANPDPSLPCGGMGPYTVTEWDPGIQIRLAAYEQWPGEVPAFQNLQLRFYDDQSQMRDSLENNAIDIAWTGLSVGDWRGLRDDPAFLPGPGYQSAIGASCVTILPSEPGKVHRRSRAIWCSNRANPPGVVPGCARPSPMPWIVKRWPIKFFKVAAPLCTVRCQMARRDMSRWSRQEIWR